MSDSLCLTFSKLQGYEGNVAKTKYKVMLGFLGQKLVASDGFEGLGTIVRRILINDKEVYAPGCPYETKYFAHDAYGNGLDLPACAAGDEISIEVEFKENTWWKANLFGEKLP